MIISVSISCVVSVAVLGGVACFADQQLLNRNQNIDIFQKDHLGRNSRKSCRTKKMCKRRGGNCQSRELVCEGQMLTGFKYCRSPRVCGCCVPPRDPPDCDLPCIWKINPVCGGDTEGFKTYDNFCLLQKAVACDPGSAGVQWIHDGECECPIICNNQYDPVCGFDGQTYQTYQNNCSLQAAIKCDTCSSNIKFEHNGECECPKICPLNWDPVCGSDGRNFKTYSNLCFLEAAVECDPNGANMELQHSGECKCQLQRVIGPCLAYIPSWYYDVDYGQCRFFIYGGCLGNANRFETYDECKTTCGHRPFNSSASLWEEDGFLVKDPTRCNDNFGSWVLQLAPKSYTEAISECLGKRMKLACPQNEYRFFQWLYKQDLTEQVWFAAYQGSGEHFNYYYWENKEEIGRYVGDINLWNFTYPKYPRTAQCVQGKQLLTNEDCTKSLNYYCSPL